MEPLIEKVQEAFADVSHPGDDHLTDSTVGEEPAALKADFRGRDCWPALSAAFLSQAPEGWGSALSFFSAPALRFYLPAYLITDIRGELFASSTPEYRLCINLTPGGLNRKIARVWGGGTVGERDQTCFAEFTPDQVAAIVDYLWWKLDDLGGYDETIEQAMENYWLKRCDSPSKPK